jgi:hypothetical protein
MDSIHSMASCLLLKSSVIRKNCCVITSSS